MLLKTVVCKGLESIARRYLPVRAWNHRCQKLNDETEVVTSREIQCRKYDV